MNNHRKRIAVLYPNAWERRLFALPRYADRFEFLYKGGDMFSFPGTLKLLTFDAIRFVDKVTEWCKRERVEGILSSDEYIGAIVVAVVARRLGMPGNDPAVIIRSQHKYFSRLAQQRDVPEATPKFELLHLSGDHALRTELAFPIFAKPCKGTYSLFASKVETAADLKRKVGYGLAERFALHRMARPYNDLLKAYSDLDDHAHAFIAEEFMSGEQATVDGFAFEGEISIMGIVDSVMFDGTQAFERFEYPSRLPLDVQVRMAELVKRMVRGLGFANGQFNVELIYNRCDDEIRIIEINPRLSYQFADLYEYIDGSNSYDVLLDLTLGRKPRFLKDRGPFSVCASFVIRTFKGKKVLSAPSSSQVAEFERRYAESTVNLYGAAGASTRAEMKASGSFRCAVINTAAHKYLDLFATRQNAIDMLPFVVR